ncbi:MAG TPA: DUF808 domain-containing protein [Candidatus Krumholzibacteria bacterium]|nr:DUF808 domain-containing protein [Candidatus Krumholzibacteria bacterium]HRX50638.1 DUF808 domain-containing protein [Candidatus Krumholzibacteria bacterium]
MPGGLVALLDDISVLARAAAASVDDIGVAASRAGVKAAGLVIDDTAVTPAYVTGLAPARELPIIAAITKGSLRNKLLIVLPAALLLSEFAPWVITPLLMLGGCYLSFEGAEKILELLGGAAHGPTLADPIRDQAAFEKKRIAGAVRTDLILSGEIMVITLNEVAHETLLVRAGVLALVGVAVTLGVYGVVGLIVKMDDVGLALARRPRAAVRRVGRALVAGMPHLLTVLSTVGTAAMLWVGGGILLHGAHELGWHAPDDLVQRLHHAASHAAGGFLGWLSEAAAAAAVGLAAGSVLVGLMHAVVRRGHDPAAH